MTFYLTQEQEHLLFLKTRLSLKLTACQERWHDCPEWARGGVTQWELGSQVSGGNAVQSGEPSSNTPPDRGSGTHCQIPFWFTFGAD